MSSSDSGGKKSCIEIDRISNLPDSVLCHILSFLPTELSIQTCVLSTRWKSLWTDVPCLHFYHKHVEKELIRRSDADFEKLVTMSLSMNRCQSLDTFHLVCLNDAERLHSFPAWLSAVITSNVRVLHLDLASSSSISMSKVVNLPNCIFTAKSLEILKLEGDMLVETLGLVSLPRLECLSLMGVKYECAESLPKLLEGCPVLKSLYIERIFYDNVGVLTVSSDTLERLDILARRMAIEQVKDIDMKLVIKAPFLKYLNLCDYASKGFSFGALPELEELHLRDYADSSDMTYYDNFFDNIVDLEDDRKWVLVLLEEISVEKLKILSIGDMEILDMFTESRKIFSSLTNLIITCSKWDWITLLQLLGKTENLKVLTLKEMCWKFDENYEAPRCLLSSIEKISVVSWIGFGANELWCYCDPNVMLAMLKYFLKHGKILRRLDLTDSYLNMCDIKYSKLYGGDTRGNFRNVLLELFSSRKSNSACELHVNAVLPLQRRMLYFAC